MKGGDGMGMHGIQITGGPTVVTARQALGQTTEQDPVVRESKACLALAKHDLPGAIGRLKRDLVASPRPESAYYMSILDLDLRRSDYADAYRVAAAVLSLYGDPSRSDVPLVPEDQLLIRASLAAAMMGEVYKGQREFCVKLVNHNDLPSFRKDYPQGDSPNDVACLSCLGIDVDDFLELALKLDPGDPWASLRLGDAYAAAFQYSKGIAVLESGLKRNDTGFAHDYMVNALKGLKYDLAKVGDGHPLKSDSSAPAGIHP